MGYKNLSDSNDVRSDMPIDWGYFTKKAGRYYISTIQCRASDHMERNKTHQDITFWFTTDDLKALIPPEVNSPYAMVNLLGHIANRRDRLAHRICNHLKKRLPKVSRVNCGNFYAVIDLLKRDYYKALRQMCLYDAFVYMMNNTYH